ncbi:MAG TPA: phosphatidylglycerophosphatase A [Burkholderiales bacterium]|nr:phosphatidylglycerophosphatase A [Burkholderiales bacterium]
MDTIISADSPPRPTWRFVLKHPAHFLAFGCGVGLMPAAPGTFGTLLAFPVYGLLAAWATPVALAAIIAVLFVAGIPLCALTGRALGRADHSGIVWDEITAFLLVLYFTPAGLLWQGAAFVLFRLFDILKPPPIRYYDRTLKGGFGVMFDDLLAAGYALVVLAIVKATTPW